jgi:outer membrane protein assembly factor BamB
MTRFSRPASCWGGACLRVAGCVLVGLLGQRLSAAGEAADWPQFRGPGGQGVSPSRGLPLTWGPKENVVWKAALPGAGTSSPIVVGARVFLTSYSGFGVPGEGRGAMDRLKLHLICLNRDDGKILWNTEVVPKLPEQAAIRENHGYASSTPASDGERVYVFFGKSGVFAFDLDGKQIWRTEVGSGLHVWGSAASPVLYGNLVIVNASVESQSLVALDRKTGKEVWRIQDIREAWNTPALVPVKDGKSELVVPMPRQVLAFDPATGERLWSCANDISWYIAPSVVANEGILWSIGGRSGVAAVAIRAGGRGDVTGTHRLWTGTKGSNVSSPVIHEGHLYWMHDRLGIACCAEAATGKIVYEERLRGAGQVYASPVLADGKLYYVTRTGRTFVLKAGPRYELLAENDLGDASTFNASPAVAGDRLLLRSDRFLYCLGRK